jgi:hypothetical protein
MLGDTQPFSLRRTHALQSHYLLRFVCSTAAVSLLCNVGQDR